MSKSKVNSDMSLADEVNENELRRAQALTGYEKRVEQIRDLQRMTDTEAWQQYYFDVQTQITKHGDAVLNAEQTREVIHHQEGVKILRWMIEKIREPVDDLNKFITSYPLFAGEMKIRAEWNASLGTVDIREI